MAARDTRLKLQTKTRAHPRPSESETGRRSAPRRARGALRSPRWFKGALRNVQGFGYNPGEVCGNRRRRLAPRGRIRIGYGLCPARRNQERGERPRNMLLTQSAARRMLSISLQSPSPSCQAPITSSRAPCPMVATSSATPTFKRSFSTPSAPGGGSAFER